jgi:hypothetical protein
MPEATSSLSTPSRAPINHLHRRTIAEQTVGPESLDCEARQLLGQFFPRWPGDAAEPALPRPPKHKPRPSAAAELVTAA